MSEKPLRGVAKTQCGGCNKYFTGMGLFDAHRIGTHGVSRRCMTTEEMIAAGMDKELCQIRVYHDGSPRQEHHEVWFDIAGREAMRQRFSRMPFEEDGAPLEGGSFEQDA